MTWWKSERSFCVACRYSTVLACLLSSPSQAMLPACEDAKGGMTCPGASWVSEEGDTHRGGLCLQDHGRDGCPVRMPGTGRHHHDPPPHHMAAMCQA